MTRTLDRRIDALEKTAPSFLKRPEGLSGEEFVQYVLTQINAMSDLPEREQARLSGAYLDLMNPTEMGHLAVLLEHEVRRRDGGGMPTTTMGSRRGPT